MTFALITCYCSLNCTQGINLSPGQTIQHFTQHFAQHFYFMLECDPTMVVKRSNISSNISANIFTHRSKKDWVDVRAEGCTVSRHFDPKKRRAIAAFPFYFLFRYFHCHRGLSGRASHPHQSRGPNSSPPALSCSSSVLQFVH